MRCHRLGFFGTSWIAALSAASSTFLSREGESTIGLASTFCAFTSAVLVAGPQHQAQFPRGHEEC